MYTKDQKKIINHVREKVKFLFVSHPVKAHSFDHALRVAKLSIIIAKSEKADLFLSEACALLHDIGRAKEILPGNKKTHHELSYELCREWFKEDRMFDALLKKEKIIILYSLRYHWNDMANKYKTAWILRDADKLDSFGKIGVRRTVEFFDNDENKIMQDLRFRYEMLYDLKSKKSKQIMQSKNLFRPIRKYQQSILKNKIKPIELV